MLRSLLLLVCLLSAVTCPAASLRPEASGAFVDRDGGRHPWRISDTHTLYFAGRPYLPVGGMFNSSYIFWEQHHNPPGRDPEAEFRRTCLRLDLIATRTEDLYLHFCTLRTCRPKSSAGVDCAQERVSSRDRGSPACPRSPARATCCGRSSSGAGRRGQGQAAAGHETLAHWAQCSGVRWVALGDERPVHRS